MTLKMKVKVKEGINRTCVFRLEMFDSMYTGEFFSSLATREHMFTQKDTKGYMHTYTYTARDRDGDCRKNMQSRFG